MHKIMDAIGLCRKMIQVWAIWSSTNRSDGWPIFSASFKQLSANAMYRSRFIPTLLVPELGGKVTTPEAD
jgi:hypothetical protein